MAELILAEGAAADTPASGKVTMYARTDGLLYSKDDVGLETAISNVVPPGVVFPYGGASAPDGYLMCDGTAHSRTTYAGLFAILGESYGVGNGTTTFNVPDLRRRVPVGKYTADTLGDSDGIAVGSRTLTHVHTLSQNSAASGGTQNDLAAQVAGTGATAPNYQIVNYIVKT